MRYVADLVGVDHVALGTDFDGAITAPIDASGMPLLTEALIDLGFAEEEIAKVMGGGTSCVYCVRSCRRARYLFKSSFALLWRSRARRLCQSARLLPNKC